MSEFTSAEKRALDRHITGNWDGNQSSRRCSSPKTRAPLPPATGTVRWLKTPPGVGYMLLEIVVKDKEGKDIVQVYEVVRDVDKGGWLLYRVEDGKIVRYHVKVINRDTWECDCPDATHRPERRTACKHSRGLAKALRSLPF